ncbi:hypothetical protein ABIA39_008990 [Nocardia sp. GAS34]|uniref:hypothetical protein n=1 Tax=unclassified Nocardia TaxID=2637762 RepID=UPI003D21504F
MTLRDWADCSPDIHRTVLGWADHPEVPAHAGRGMVVASIARELRPTSEVRLHRTVHNWIVFDGDRPVAFLAADIQPEWIAPEEFWPSESYVDSPPEPTMSFWTLIDPALWGRGCSTAAKSWSTRPARHSLKQDLGLDVPPGAGWLDVTDSDRDQVVDGLMLDGEPVRLVRLKPRS